MTEYRDAYEHLSPVWIHYTPVVASRAEGCYIYDQAGTAYLDFTCGIAVTNTGHCHPKVVDAIRNGDVARDLGGLSDVAALGPRRGRRLSKEQGTMFNA